ncbi:MerR family DNA-binding transcriptional regulator [Trichococcus shcherbakoviae]|nr:MerR family DNA-binding transcriptional regulator [Trichococcus shcherbakoviae]
MSYSIGEFSKMIGLPVSTLRYYENEGLLKPDRDENNLRV